MKILHPKTEIYNQDLPKPIMGKKWECKKQKPTHNDSSYSRFQPSNKKDAHNSTSNVQNNL